VNLAATSLPALRWLDDADDASAGWIRRYVEGWLARADANGGLLPDNVGPDGTVGALQEGDGGAATTDGPGRTGSTPSP
jgi:hypothetical protein